MICTRVGQEHGNDLKQSVKEGDQLSIKTQF
jgi:hypothetical protein